MSDPSAETLAEYMAERAVQRLILQYARAIDAFDLEQVRPLFFEDAQLHYGESFSGPREDALKWLGETAHFLAKRTHYNGPPLTTLDPTKTMADATYWCINMIRFAPAGDGSTRETVSGLTYNNKFAQRDGCWKISELRVSTDWTVVQPKKELRLPKADSR